MRSLFEKEEKETALSQLKVALIFGFYPLRKDEIMQYKSLITYDICNKLENNHSVQWDMELIDFLDEKFNWTLL